VVQVCVVFTTVGDTTGKPALWDADGVTVLNGLTVWLWSRERWLECDLPGVVVAVTLCPQPTGRHSVSYYHGVWCTGTTCVHTMVWCGGEVGASLAAELV